MKLNQQKRETKHDNKILQEGSALTLTFRIQNSGRDSCICFASGLPGDLKPAAKHLGDLVYLSVKHLPTPGYCEIKCPQSVVNSHVCIIFSLAFKVCWANPDGDMKQNQNSNEPGGSKLLLLCSEWGCTKLSYISKEQMPAPPLWDAAVSGGSFVCYSCWVDP